MQQMQTRRVTSYASVGGSVTTHDETENQQQEPVERSASKHDLPYRHPEFEKLRHPRRQPRSCGGRSVLTPRGQKAREGDGIGRVA
jgi:hypothetical protein